MVFAAERHGCERLQHQTSRSEASDEAAGRQQSAPVLPVGVFWAPAGNSWPFLCSQPTWKPPPHTHTHPAGGPGRREASRDVTQTGWAFTHRPGSTNEQASLGYIYSLHSRRPYCLAREEGEQRPPDNGGARRVASFAPAFGLLQPLLPRPVRRQRLTVAPREGGLGFGKGPSLLQQPVVMVGGWAGKRGWG